jgi:asparagine synthase (glutamine-hydrolysing)
MQMDYRGPDASGCFEINNVKLGHNRLSILDLNPRSNQPFTSNDGRYIIIYNGEIYNYLDLAKKYNILMKTHSDTELILELSIIIGFKNALNEFNGIFAYIIFDTVTQDYFIARDRLGVKPLYYYHVGNNYIFSSEINAIVVLLKNDIQIDEIGLRQYRKLRTFFNGYTIYKDIKMFPAGCFMEHKIITAYWEMPMGEQKPPDDDELKDLIEDSIKCRKIADVPLGSYLSGGLDSTIVAAITKELHTWTVGFEENNEFKWGRLAAKKIGSNHHEIITNSQMFINDTKVMIKRRKEPLSVPNEVLLYEMTKEVKKENTVVLCGEGADELFFGYNRIFSWANRTDTFDIKNFSNLYAYGSNDDLEIVESVISPFYKYGKPINIVAAFFQVAHLHGLLRRLDSSTMLCSVEAREPFVDYRLVERMAGVSFTYRMQDGIVKAPLKRIFKDIVPIEIIEREKVGFPVDLAHIFKVHTEKAFDYWLDFNMNVLMQGR